MTSSPGDAPRQSGGEPRATTEGGGAPEERVRTARGRTRCGFRPRTGSQRTSGRPCASPMGTGGRRCAHGRPRTYPLARCCAPHHGPHSRRRFSFSGHEKRRAPLYRSSEAVCAFSARACPFSLRLVSPRGPPSLPSPFPLEARLRFRVLCGISTFPFWKSSTFPKTGT